MFVFTKIKFLSTFFNYKFDLYLYSFISNKNALQSSLVEQKGCVCFFYAIKFIYAVDLNLKFVCFFIYKVKFYRLCLIVYKIKIVYK